MKRFQNILLLLYTILLLLQFFIENPVSESSTKLLIGKKKNAFNNTTSSQALLSALEEQDAKLGSVDETLNILMQQVDNRTPSSTQLGNAVLVAKEKQKRLITELQLRKDIIQEDIAHASLFQESLKDLEGRLTNVAEQMSDQQPISTDPDTVGQQLENAKVSKPTLNLKSATETKNG